MSEKSTVTLRALEPTDVDFLYKIENDEKYWYLSSISSPYSKHVLEQYLEAAHLDIYTTKQVRFIIEKSGVWAGAIDLYEFDPKHRRAGVGIFIQEELRSKGVGQTSLSLLIKYCRETLDLHQLYATIPEGNLASIKLFSNSGFIRCGLKMDWLRNGNKWESAVEMQLIM